MDANVEKTEDREVAVENDINPDRSLIIQKRRERRKALRQERKLEREYKARQNLQKPSEKLLVIPLKQFEKVQAASQNQTSLQSKRKLINTRKKVTFYSNDFNILDLIAKRKLQKRPIRRMQSNTVIRKIRKGKRRETPGKKKPRGIRRKILEYRRIKSELKTNAGLEDIISKISAVKLEEPNEKNTVHSRKFRPYCDNLTSIKLKNLSESFLKDIFRFQKRAYDKSIIKGTAHRRYFVGLKEVEQKINVNKIKLIFFAPDCEECDLPGGLDEAISRIKLKCTEKNVPYIFSIRRHRLATILKIKVPVACVGVIDYDGVGEIYHQLVSQLEEERNNYNKLIAEV